MFSKNRQCKEIRSGQNIEESREYEHTSEEIKA